MRAFALTLTILLLAACAKEQSRAVKFQASCITCSVEYGLNGSVSAVNVNGSWSTSTTAKVGDQMYLQVCRVDSPSTFSGWVFLDNEQVTAFSVGGTWPDSCSALREEVPER